MRIVKKNRFKNLGELHKEWTEAGVKTSRVTTHRRVKEFGYSCRQRRLTWAKEKKNWTVAQWSKVLFSDDLGCNVICWCWSIVFFKNQRHCTCLPIFVYQMCTKFWSTSCFLLLTSFLKMLISFSSRIWHLPTLPKAPKVG